MKAKELVASSHENVGYKDTIEEIKKFHETS